ncbi:Murein hydrolase activator NlpD precursor [Phocoenobacter uteri]|uniref:Murein hydrolase activator NlpD n=1 Tax=Phocoenobacter uteri TaxID=146806 RepID=A0A379CBD2_9PAST|nr:peptidoglycan DD-metalloendopeptidase family protein [Phocoenobacter uteri]MDG6881421.1 hypothetical protein [Phocoenobacter uteri]SUB59449.1 Murein hydrolase activator NlpD precursor [Phocoenobacter uteri]
MKKSLLLLPLGAVALGACSTDYAAPVEYVSKVKSPVAKKMAKTQYQRQRLAHNTQIPAPIKTMSQPQKTVALVTNKPTNMTVNNVKPVAKPIQPVVKKVTEKVRVKEKEVEKAITIPRDEQTNKPIYSKIDKGSYEGNIYTVRKGDTIFLIAYIAGMDVPEVAELNGLKAPYPLHIGQKIKLSSGYKEKVVTKEVVVPVPQPVKPKEPEVTYVPAANGTAYGSDGSVKGPIKASVGQEKSQVSVSHQTEKSVKTAPKISHSLRWNWPTAGRISSYFSSSDGGNKGIDIKGSKGQSVKSAANGQVVYAGDALQGYGNLIIIKHDDNYLSAYAHNDEILVEENDKVKLGQRIATMGNTGTDSTKLHFEIRYKGKSVNPMDYLPKR